MPGVPAELPAVLQIHGDLRQLWRQVGAVEAKKRDTWETQGGHIEPGETPLEAAKRELFEESGIRDADVYPVCDYWGFNPFRCSNGMVFLAVVHSIGELPESEMQEIRMFEELPENLTYPQTSPVLYREAEKLLKSLERK